MTETKFPTAELLIECSMINPPKPLGITVRIEAKIVATLSLDYFKERASRLAELESAHSQ